MKYTEAPKRLLALLEQEGLVTAKEAADTLQVSIQTAYYHLANLRRDGSIQVLHLAGRAFFSVRTPTPQQMRVACLRHPRLKPLIRLFAKAGWIWAREAKQRMLQEHDVPPSTTDARLRLLAEVGILRTKTQSHRRYYAEAF